MTDAQAVELGVKLGQSMFLFAVMCMAVGAGLGFWLAMKFETWLDASNERARVRYERLQAEKAARVGGEGA